MMYVSSWCRYHENNRVTLKQAAPNITKMIKNTTEYVLNAAQSNRQDKTGKHQMFSMLPIHPE